MSDSVAVLPCPYCFRLTPINEWCICPEAQALRDEVES